MQHVDVVASFMCHIGGAGGCTWGMLEDAEEVAGSSMEVDWRKHTLKNKLTEKQEKLVDKIRCVGHCSSLPSVGCRSVGQLSCNRW